MTDTVGDDFYKPFGEAKWKEFAETVQASDLQLRFSVARFNGASAAAAAKIAGYSGDHDAIRRAGYQAVRSAAVVALLDLAAVHAPAENALTDAEVDSRLARLVRSPDPLIMLKATELYDKRKARAKEAGTAPEDDGFSEWRACRDFLLIENGASQFMLYYRAKMKALGHPANYPLLHDVHALASKEPFGMQIWEYCNGDLSEVMRDHLYKQISNPNWQLEARQKIWAEIGVRLDDRGQFSSANAA
jgi:hypothetical protein